MDTTTDMDGARLLRAAERHAQARGWPRRWADPATLYATCNGVWSDYRLTVRWSAAAQTVSVDCRFAVAPPNERAREVRRLHSDLSTRLGVGALALDLDEGRALFSQIAQLDATPQGLRRLGASIQAAVETCDLFFPAFQLVAWAGSSAEAAMRSTLFASMGRA